MEVHTLAEVNTEADGLLAVSSRRAVRVSALDKVLLQVRHLAEAVVHVGLGAVERRVLGDDILEAVDLHLED